MQNTPQRPHASGGDGSQPVRRAAAPQSRPAQPSSTAPRPVQRTAQAPVQRTAPAQRTAQPAQARPAARQTVPARTAAQPVRRTAQPAAAKPRQSAPVKSTASFNRAPSLIKPLAMLALALAIGILLQFVILPGGWVMAEKARANSAVAEISSTRGVRINEVMTANKAACFDENGACPDWIELYNAGNSAVNITGWVLTDKTSRSIRFTFPDTVMQPGEYAIVFADGFLHNDADETWHAPFKLSAFGDTLLLFDENGTIVESINIPALNEDCVYARTASGGWEVTREYTPLMENTTVNYASLTSTQVQPGSDLVISEVMASNASYRAPSGMLCDWIEIANRGSTPINLSGYGLSDKTTKPSRWRFPDVTIQPGEYLVVYASGLDRVTETGEIHLSFRLSAERESVYLYTPSRQIIDAVSWENLKTDQSYKRQDGDSWAVSTTPTPGSAN